MSEGLYGKYTPIKVSGSSEPMKPADRIEALEAELRESRLAELAALGQAEEAYEKQKELEAENARYFYALRAIANLEVWPDNLMSDKDIARAALKEKNDE